MKHAAVLYTCIGLMGAAAVTGFVDYTQASNAGILADLYQDEKPTTGSTLMLDKDISIEDYSRGPLEEEVVLAEDFSNDEKKLVEKPKPIKRVRSAPPPPPKLNVNEEPVVDTDVPVAASPADMEKDVAEMPTMPPAPAIEAKIEAPPVPVEEVKEVTFSPRIFSRAPLPSKTTAAKKKKRS